MSGSTDPFIAEWVPFVKNPGYNTAEKCLKMAQMLEYPDLDVEEYVEKMRGIGLSLAESLADVKNPTYLVSMLNEHLFDNLGYGGDHDDYFNPKNNFLNEVIDGGAGVPITLSVLYAEVAKFVGLDLRIVGFPGHVLVKHGEEMVLDPFHGGILLGADDLQARLDESFGDMEMRPEYLDEIGDSKVLVRIARNLKNSYTQSFAYDKAVRCADMVLAVEPESAEDVRDKGMLEARRARYGEALGYLNRYLELSPNAEDVDHVLEVIRGIKRRD